MNQVEQAILKTICYAQVFNYPLSEEEIFLYLISNKKISLSSIRKGLTQLKDKKSLTNTNDYYHLSTNIKQVTLRLERRKYSQEKLEIANNVCKELKGISGLTAVFLTGAVAMENADLEDDIDLMLVTRPSALWTTRVKVLIKLERMGIRRKPKITDYKNLVCPNIFMDESAFTIPKKQRNLYTAHEVAQVKALWQEKSQLDNFFGANKWINTYLANFHIKQGDKKKEKAMSPSLMERLAYRLQLHYMKQKKTNEKVSPVAAFFHPGNRTDHILKEYQKNISQFGL
jgi:hypothetical protein